MEEYKNISTNNDQNAEFNTPEEPPKGEAVKCMVFGILSIFLTSFLNLGIVGLIFGILARTWSLPIIKNYPNNKKVLAFKFILNYI